MHHKQPNLVVCLFFFIVMSSALSTCFAEVHPYDIILTTGKKTYIATPEGVPVHLQNGSVLKLADLNTKISITGKKQGRSVLSIAQKKYNILVLSAQNHLIFSKVYKIIKPFLGLKVDFIDKKIQVLGHLYRMSDWFLLAKEFENSKQQYFFTAKIEPEIEQQIKAHIHRNLNSQKIPTGKWSFTPHPSILYSYQNENYKPLILKITKPYGLQLRFDKNTIGLEPMVKVKILIAEVNKTARNKIGIQWPTSYTASIAPQVSEVPIEVILNALESKGLSKTLASPTLLCKSGGSAEFLAGGEIPIKASGYQFSSVTWKRHGIFMNIKPRADHTGQMSIAITIEVSSLAESGGQTDIPSFKTHKVTSHVDLKDSQTIVLSGLIKHQQISNSSGVDTLSSIPILGELFKSKDYLNNKSELVVFITPSLVKEVEKNINIKDHYPAEFNLGDANGI